MKKGAVAFLDILGFKGIWQSRGADDVLSLLNSVPELVIQTYKQPPPEKNWPESSEPSITILSDTIVITIKSNEPHCILLLVDIINKILVEFHRNNIFLRGSVGYGEYIQSGNTYIGPVIDDVAEWHEKADWIGIISTPKTNYLLDTFSTITFGVNNYKVASFLKYEVPIKGNLSANLYCLNWPGFMQASFNESPQKGLKSKVRIAMENLFSKQPEFNISVLKKYENTLNFIDYAVGFIEDGGS
jgi:hypothetical protein